MAKRKLEALYECESKYVAMLTEGRAIIECDEYIIPLTKADLENMAKMLEILEEIEARNRKVSIAQ